MRMWGWSLVLARPLTHRSRFRTFCYLVLLLVLLSGLLVTPVSAASITSAHTARSQVSTPAVNATIYLTTSSLDALFQSRISALVPAAFNSSINTTLNQLPQQDRGWASQMISTLIQPSATLTGLVPVQNGLAASLRIALYPGDPQPINASMLVSFQVLNATTIQVSVEPLHGSPALTSGPIATIPVTTGQLQSVAATPNCGSSALGIHLQIPFALPQGQSNVQTQTQHYALSDFLYQQQALHLLQQSDTHIVQSNLASTNAFIEMPASSLTAIGNSIGTLPINSSLTAKNIQIGVQGKDLTITSAIYASFWGQIGTAVTTVAPTVSNGSLAVNVLNTSITILGIFTFPYNSYNQQIQQTLNAKLNGAFAGKFNVTQAQIGPTANLPCAANNSLVLAGTTSIG